jgi:hypothetical protein
MGKYSTVYAMGCSFVQGSELGLENRPLPSIPVESVPGRFSEIVAHHFDAKHVNLAQGGAGQSRIFRSTVDWIENNTFNNERVLFLIGLSYPERQEVWVNEKEAYFKWNFYNNTSFTELVSPNTIRYDKLGELRDDFNEDDLEKFKRFYLEYVFNEEECYRDSFRYVRALKSFIKEYVPNYDLFIFNALGENWTDDQREKMGLDSKYSSSWANYISKNDLADPCCWHPKEAAHKEMANYIIKKYG